MRRYRPAPPSLTALLLLLVACSEASAPEEESRPEEELSVLAVAPTGAQLVVTEASFYARKGEDREVRLFLQDADGTQSDEYLRLRIDAGTLLALPDGSPIAAGDSVLITVRAVDPARMLFEMEPAGLRFDPSEPAELRVRYRLAGADLNADGKVDTLDAQIEGLLALWRQENPRDPFVRLATILMQDAGEIEADLEGFSRFVVAY